MIDLNRLFDNWFADPEFSVAEKLYFGDDMRTRLAQNNDDGFFDPLLVELDGAVSAAGGATSDEAVGIAVRKAAVKAKVDLLNNLRTTVSRRSGRVADAFGKKSVEYGEFFPQGLDVWHHLKEGEVVTNLDVVIAAAHKHLPDLEAEFASLKSSWVAAKKSAGDQVAAVDNVNVSQKDAIGALELVMKKAVLTAALHFLNKEGMGTALFDQTKLYNPQKTKPTPPASHPSAGTAPAKPS